MLSRMNRYGAANCRSGMAKGRMWRACCSGFPVVVYGQRCMIAETLILVDGDGLRCGCQIRRSDLIVDTPAYVLGPGLTTVAPPGVLIGARIYLAEYIDQSDFVEDARQPGALFRQKAGILAIAFIVLEIDFIVRDVPVATDHEL